jgi:adenylate kinase family enzyme
MKRIFKILTISTLGIMTYILLGASCLPKVSIPVNGFLFGRNFTTTVDNQLAKEMLSEDNDENVTKLFSTYANKPLNTTTLSEISKKYSMDVSTLYFLEKSYENPKNKEAQDLYLNYFDQLSDNNFKQKFEHLQDVYVAFVPGLDYLDTTNGGDFAKQRRLFTSNGIQNELILTESWGFADRNAEIVAKRLKELNKQHEKIIVVSASKGGLDVAIALGKLLKAEDISSVKAWVSVGGILKGSPVADKYLSWPKCWVAEIGLLFVGQKISLIKDVSYKKRTEDFKNFNFPEHITRVHFIGAPLATQIHKRIKSNYCSIKDYGPNDGITPLADEVSDGGIVVSELGFDHYYKHPDLDKKTLALALTVINLQK